MSTSPRKLFYSVEEVAAILGVLPRTVRSLVRRGEIRAYKIGKFLRIAKSDFHDYMEGRRVDSLSRHRETRGLKQTNNEKKRQENIRKQLEEMGV